MEKEKDLEVRDGANEMIRMGNTVNTQAEPVVPFPFHYPFPFPLR